MLGIVGDIKRKSYPFRRKLIKRLMSAWYWSDKLPYYLGLKKCPPKGMPDFIIAGLPKCGTVWMVRVLRSDSQFQYFENPFFENKGEIRFFTHNFNQPITKYFEVFDSEIRDPSKLAYEKSPDYSIMNIDRIKLLKKLKPDIKTILVFRDPVDRAFSNAKMDLSRKGIELSPENEHHFLEHYKSQGKLYDYERILKNWYSVFDSSQILVLSLEDIGEKPYQVIERIYTFLGKEINIDHDLYENPNATSKSPIPLSHQSYLKDTIGSIINYWESNRSLFRIE